MMDGITISSTPNIKILGITNQDNGKNTQLIQKLDWSTAQTVRILRRIASQKHAMKEQDMLTLVQTFVFLRMTYVAPYATFLAVERWKIDTIIRTAFKQVPGLSTTASISHKIALGGHNIIHELKEAHLDAHKAQISTTPKSHQVLIKLGYTPLMKMETG
ncbi:hypothetical protein HPB48_017680 [Haemaphysalis longicornis]|uniref:Uncharacterized protein n=1 Tax=Haemaphysalis longicornis TaxID=44386 RepID=A0A9J6FAL2_HAELO|nr:hypothetical protein HPB48_017680 [Haemaphysalis longicornis]